MYPNLFPPKGTCIPQAWNHSRVFFYPRLDISVINVSTFYCGEAGSVTEGILDIGFGPWYSFIEEFSFGSEIIFVVYNGM